MATTVAGIAPDAIDIPADAATLHAFVDAATGSPDVINTSAPFAAHANAAEATQAGIRIARLEHKVCFCFTFILSSFRCWRSLLVISGESHEHAGLREESLATSVKRSGADADENLHGRALAVIVVRRTFPFD